MSKNEIKLINSCSGITSKELKEVINKRNITQEQIVSILYAKDRFHCYYYE